MPDKNQFLWLFFSFAGRINRAVYILTFLFMLAVVSFPLYQFMRVPEESPAAQTWSVLFGVTFAIFLWVHISSSVKRLHDMGKPGIIAVSLFIPIVSFIAFLALCVFPGEPGPNRYARQTNAAK